jgi:hypothetical protein
MGDEQLISVAADRMSSSVRSATAYLYRYSTGRNFRLLSTNCQFNAFSVVTESLQADSLLLVTDPTPWFCIPITCHYEANGFPPSIATRPT